MNNVFQHVKDLREAKEPPSSKMQPELEVQTDFDMFCQKCGQN